MLRHLVPTVFLLALGLAGPAAAQTAAQTAAPPAVGVQPEQDALRATHGDWELRCAEGGAQEVCYLSQVLNNEEGDPLLRAVVRRIDGGRAQAILTVQAPLGVVLPEGLAMSIDGSEPQAAPFLYCLPNGCYAQVAVAQEGLNRLRRGANANITVYSVQQPETPVRTPLSLMGFTAGYDALG